MSKSNQKPWEGFHVAYPITVRWRDLDANGHATNSVYFNYFEEARIELWRRVEILAEGFSKKPHELKYTSALIRTSAEYRKQAFLNQKLIVAAKFSQIRRIYIDTEYVIYDAENYDLIARGTASNIIAHVENYKPIRIPKEIISEIEKLG